MSYQQNKIKMVKRPIYQSQLYKAQQGVVIIVALFIVALVATMAYIMMARLSRDTERTALLLRDNTAEFYAQGSIAWAIDQLRNDFDQQKKDQVMDRVPIHSPIDIVNDYKIESTILDIQSRFNLNNLTDVSAQEDFKRLLRVVDAKLSEEKAREIVRATFSWITPSQNELDQYYLTLPTPYRAAKKPMFDASELRLVKGMTPALFEAIKPYVIALPLSNATINIQTAPLPVLMMLSPSMTMEVAKLIMEQRITKPFLSVPQFSDWEVVKNQGISPTKITVSSDYFLVETNVSVENQHLLLYTLLKRLKKNNNKALVVPLWQSKASW